MKKYYIIIIIIIISLSLIMFFKVNKKENISTINAFNNDIFTKELFIDLIEIDYWKGDNKIIIDNKEDLNSIYNAFASLKLTKYTPDSEKYGPTIIDFITKNDKLGVGLASDVIVINGIYYHTNKDIVTIVRDIAFQNEN